MPPVSEEEEHHVKNEDAIDNSRIYQLKFRRLSVYSGVVLVRRLLSN